MTDGQEARPPRGGNLSKEYEAARSRSLPNQDHQALCSERATLLLGCYRRNDANDPDTYVGAIAMVLSKYPAAIVEWATDPRTGIQATENFRSFPPNSGELMALCEAEVRRIHEASKPGRPFRKGEYTPRRTDPGCWANVFVGPLSPNYPSVIAYTKSKEADPRQWRYGAGPGNIDGIWIALPVCDELRGDRRIGKNWKAPSDAELRAYYGEREIAARADKEFTE
jgi:hypothetical protein